MHPEFVQEQQFERLKLQKKKTIKVLVFTVLVGILGGILLGDAATDGVIISNIVRNLAALGR